MRYILWLCGFLFLGMLLVRNPPIALVVFALWFAHYRSVRRVEPGPRESFRSGAAQRW